MKQDPRQLTGRHAYFWGLWAERMARLILLVKGYRILGTRIKTPGGEIDLLASKKDTLVVVEVKRRANDFAAASAISPHQQARLLAAAHSILPRYPGHDTLRFDAILFAPGRLPRHIRNAFQ